MRHSYCSYWLAANNSDVDRLVLQSGHEDERTLWEHYYRPTLTEDARQVLSNLSAGSKLQGNSVCSIKIKQVSVTL